MGEPLGVSTAYTRWGLGAQPSPGLNAQVSQVNSQCDPTTPEEGCLTHLGPPAVPSGLGLEECP